MYSERGEVSNKHIIISREISIEHASVGLASLAQQEREDERRAKLDDDKLLQKWFPLQGERVQSLKVFKIRMLGFNYKIEMRKRRWNNNRPINLPQGNNILHMLYVQYLTQNFISRAYMIFNICCVTMYVS